MTLYKLPSKSCVQLMGIDVVDNITCSYAPKLMQT